MAAKIRADAKRQGEAAEVTDRWQKWIRGEINKAQDATALRFTETERRLGELEARLAEQEAPQAAPTGAGSSLRVVSGGQP